MPDGRALQRVLVAACYGVVADLQASCAFVHALASACVAFGGPCLVFGDWNATHDVAARGSGECQESEAALRKWCVRTKKRPLSAQAAWIKRRADKAADCSARAPLIHRIRTVINLVLAL